MPFLLKKITLVSLCYAYRLIRGNATHVPQIPRAFAVIQMAKLGDMVCTTPVFHALKMKYPEAQVTVVGNTVNKALLQGNSDIDSYAPFPGLLALASFLRKERFDAVIVVGPDIASLAAAYLSNARCILAPEVTNGSSPLCDRWYRALLPLVIVRAHAMGSYAPREYLRLLEPLSIQTDDTAKHLGYSEDARANVDAFINEHELRSGAALVGILPRAGNKVKEWPVERFVEVATTLAGKGSCVVLIGGPDDSVTGEIIAEQVAEVVNACGRFALDETKAFIDSLDLLIGVDTGPVYIAEAFGTPTIDIVGPMDEREQPPIGERHIVLTPPSPRTPELHIMDAHPKDEREARRQTLAITVDAVTSASYRLLRI